MLLATDVITIPNVILTVGAGLVIAGFGYLIAWSTGYGRILEKLGQQEKTLEKVVTGADLHSEVADLELRLTKAFTALYVPRIDFDRKVGELDKEIERLRADARADARSKST